jgi:hypothetical protein
MKGDAMLLGVPRDVRLTSARETFLLDCKAAGFSALKVRIYGRVLASFIKSVGDMKVRELGPDHVRLYVSDLADRQGSPGRKPSSRLLRQHYIIVRNWVRWMYVQKMIEQRVIDLPQPALRQFPPGRLAAC